MILQILTTNPIQYSCMLCKNYKYEINLNIELYLLKEIKSKE